MKFKIYCYKKVTSTNDMAMDLIREKNIKQGFILSDLQTKGRGTKGRRWISKKENLFISLFFELKKNLPSFHEFSIINPVILHGIIKKFSKLKQINIKWPNDILLNKKKICGILQEVIQKNKTKYLIIGIGINIFSNPQIKNKKITNIKKETKKILDKKVITLHIIESYQNFFNNIKFYKFSDYRNKSNALSIK